MARKESNRTGVYCLIGDDDEVPGRMRVYIGESDNVGKGLRDHVNDDEKGFWEYAIAVTSKDENLTKTHGLFLESKIIERAMLAGRVTLDNSQLRPYESIPESDVSDMTYFLNQVGVVLPALGVELFSPVNLEKAERDLESGQSTNSSVLVRAKTIQPSTGPESIEVILRDSVFGIEARGLESNGEVLVLKGSRARGENESETNVYRQLRGRLIKEGKIVSTDDPRILEFASDVVFNSPSAASAVILDRNDNGRSSWREMKTNKSLNAWYAEQANNATQPTDA